MNHMLEAVTQWLAAHLAQHQTEGQDWPNDAEFAIVYQLQCWPLGFGERHVKFFNDLDAVKAEVEEKRQWTRLEDNNYRFHVLRWNLGPELYADGWCSAGCDCFVEHQQ